MKVIRNKNKNFVLFSELKPGDTFMEANSKCEFCPEMKIKYGDISYEFRGAGEEEEGFASVLLDTGNVFFYTDDFYVIPIKLKAVEEE